MLNNEIVSRTGYVYVLSNRSYSGLYKVGYTTRNLESRVAELSGSTGVPTPFEIKYSMSFVDCIAAEKMIHLILDHSGGRVASNREFFTLDLEKIIATVNYVKEILDNNSTTEHENKQKTKSEIHIEEAKKIYEQEKLLGGEKKIERELLKAAKLGDPKGYYLLGKLYKDKSLAKTYSIKNYEEMMFNALKVDEKNNPEDYKDGKVSDFFKELIAKELASYYSGHDDESRTINNVKNNLSNHARYKTDNPQTLYDIGEKSDSIFAPDINVIKIYRKGFILLENDPRENNKELKLEFCRKILTRYINRRIEYSSEYYSVDNEWEYYYNQTDLTNMNSEDSEFFQKLANLEQWGEYFSANNSFGSTIDEKKMFNAFLEGLLSIHTSDLTVNNENIDIIRPLLNNVLYLIRDYHIHSKDKEMDRKHGNSHKKTNGFLCKLISDIDLESRKENQQSDYIIYGFLQFIRNVNIEYTDVIERESKTVLSVRVVDDKLNINDNISVFEEYSSRMNLNMYHIERMYINGSETKNIERGKCGEIILNRKITDMEKNLLQSNNQTLKVIGNRSNSIPETIDPKSDEIIKSNQTKQYIQDFINDYENTKNIDYWIAMSKSNNQKKKEEEEEQEQVYNNNIARKKPEGFLGEIDYNGPMEPYLPEKWYYWTVSTIIIYMFSDLFFFLSAIPIVGIIFLVGLSLVFLEGIAQFANFLINISSRGTILNLLIYMIYISIAVPIRFIASLLYYFIVLMIDLIIRIIKYLE